MLKNGPLPASFSVYFRLFSMLQLKFKFKLIKVLIVRLGFEPGTAGWKAQTNPLSYGGTPNIGQMLSDRDNFIHLLFLLWLLW